MKFRQNVLIATAASLLLWTIAASLPSAAAYASELRVIDADTLAIDGQIFRLHGIDAPEAGQDCAKAGGGYWNCGKAAIAAMNEIALSSPLKCDNRGSDDYDRIIAVCKNADGDIGKQLIELGLAWAFLRYSDDYLADEKIARRKALGVWETTTETPWDFRARRWEVGKQEAPDGCPIKGNISKNGNIYHAPWSPWYERTKLSPKKGERWFCTEAEAIHAGWRAPYWGGKAN